MEWDWAWFTYPQVKRPVHPSIVSYIQSIDISTLLSKVSSHVPLSPSTTFLVTLSHFLILHGLLSGLTLYDIACIVCRHDHEEKPSKLEVIIEEAEESAYRTIELETYPECLSASVGTGASDCSLSLSSLSGSGDTSHDLSFSTSPSRRRSSSPPSLLQSVLHSHLQLSGDPNHPNDSSFTAEGGVRGNGVSLFPCVNNDHCHCECATSETRPHLTSTISCGSFGSHGWAQAPSKIQKSVQNSEQMMMSHQSLSHHLLSPSLLSSLSPITERCGSRDRGISVSTMTSGTDIGDSVGDSIGDTDGAYSTALLRPELSSRDHSANDDWAFLNADAAPIEIPLTLLHSLPIYPPPPTDSDPHHLQEEDDEHADPRDNSSGVLMSSNQGSRLPLPLTLTTSDDMDDALIEGVSQHHLSERSKPIARYDDVSSSPMRDEGQQQHQSPATRHRLSPAVLHRSASFSGVESKPLCPFSSHPPAGHRSDFPKLKRRRTITESSEFRRLRLEFAETHVLSLLRTVSQSKGYRKVPRK